MTAHINKQNLVPINGNSRRQTGRVSMWLIAPLGLIVLIIVLYLLFANMIMKNIAEAKIGETVGAEVNIAQFDHSLFPLGLTLSDVQVTDSAKPNTNKVAVGVLSADVDFMPLLSKKVIINNLLAENIAFSTERKHVGDVYRKPDPANSFALPSFKDLPSVDELLTNSPLKTTAAVEQASQTLSKYEQPLQQQYDTLPNKQKMADYKARMAIFKDMDFKDPAQIASATSEFKKLKAEIKQDKDNIEAFVSLAQQAKEDVTLSVNALKSAPKQDYELLKNLLAGDEDAIAQVSQLLFGEKAEQYTQALIMAANLLLNSAPQEPLTNNDSYPELPNVWIKKADISVTIMGESLTSTWSNITDQHAKVGTPTVFSIQSLNAKNWQAFTLNGQLEILGGMVNASQSWDIKGILLKGLTLIPEGAQQKLSAILNSGILDSKGTLIIDANQLSGTSVFDLAKLDLGAKGKNDLSKTLATVISQQTHMQLTGLFAGSLRKPLVSISSDLDNNLVKSLGADLANNPKLAELKQKLNEKATAALGSTTEQLDHVQILLSTAQGDTDALSELLKTEISNKKEQILDKLKDKLFK